MHPLNGPAARLVPDGLDATLVLVRHGESTLIAQERFQGQMETPLSATGLRQADLVAARLARPHDAPALPVPAGALLEIVHSPLQRTSQTAAAIASSLAASGLSGVSPGDGQRRPAASVGLRPEPGLLEIGQGVWEGLLATEVAERYVEVLAAWRRHPMESWAPGGESLPTVAERVRPALGAVLARLGAGRAPGTQDRKQVAGYRDPLPDHPWSIVVGHDGVFKVLLLLLFDLPLERFWMWSMDLCAISVVELRAGRPVLRAHNLTAHLAGLLDDEAQAELEDRSRSGAL
jgi:broad specificity phosphatase PhoE